MPTCGSPVGDGQNLTRTSDTGGDVVGELADALDLDGRDVTDLQRTNACGRAGKDHVARQQRHDVADELDEGRDAVHHVGGTAALAYLTVDGGDQLEV